MPMDYSMIEPNIEEGFSSNEVIANYTLVPVTGNESRYVGLREVSFNGWIYVELGQDCLRSFDEDVVPLAISIVQLYETSCRSRVS